MRCPQPRPATISCRKAMAISKPSGGVAACIGATCAACIGAAGAAGGAGERKPIEEMNCSPARILCGRASFVYVNDRSFAANAVRLQLHALAYNLGNFLRTLATPEPIKDWSLTSLKEKLIKIGAKIASHGRYVVFQMAEVAIPKNLFANILRLIAELRPPLVISTA